MNSKLFPLLLIFFTGAVAFQKSLKIAFEPKLSRTSLISSRGDLQLKATFDPAAIIGEFGAKLVLSPAIVAVPIVGGIGVALLVALFIVNSANPADPDD